jgi:hypothetical protein
VRSTPGNSVERTDGSTHEVKFSGLTNGTSYTFHVVATNAVGDSSPGRTGSATPKLQKIRPGPPITASAIAGNRSAVVIWQAPASDGGSTITGYRVESTPGSFDQEIQNGSARSVTASNLTNGTSLYVRSFRNKCGRKIGSCYNK